MENFKGTKGEWKTHQIGNGNIIVSSPEWRDFITVKFVHPIENTKQRREECLANAKLIESAPELLKALSQVLANTAWHRIENKSLQNAIQAIKKATS